MIVPGLDRTALDTAARTFNLRLVVLFGSYANGSPPPGPDSDLDLAISFAPGAPKGRLWDVHAALSRVFPDHTLDIVDLADADPLFRWEIMAPAILLHGDPLDFLELRAFASRDFIDSADLRTLERTLFERKMELLRRRLRCGLSSSTASCS